MEWIRELLTDWEKWLNPYRNIPEKQIFTAAVLCVFLAVFVRFFRWKFGIGGSPLGLEPFIFIRCYARRSLAGYQEAAVFVWSRSGASGRLLILAAGNIGIIFIGNILMFIPAGFFVERITGVLVKDEDEPG